MVTTRTGRATTAENPGHLPDGTAIRFRPITGSDRDAIRARFHLLSHKSRALRFLREMPDELSENLLVTLVDHVDGIHHIALGAFIGDEPVAIGRLVRSDDHAGSAELAVSVRDEWHGRGVATLLTAELLGLAPEVRQITALVAAENRASFALMEKLGAVSLSCDGGVCEATVTLNEPPAPVAPSPRAHRFLRRR
ncbi:MAG: GCN5-related N-acetyltransferase [Pseudonocardiales bacterium]|nr:GCN5-related N-acetyltransferase [Pseudonocardiales bacterium]